MTVIRLLLIACLLAGGPFAGAALADDSPAVEVPSGEGADIEDADSHLSPPDKLAMALLLWKNTASTPADRVRAAMLLYDAAEAGLAPAQSALAWFIFSQPELTKLDGHAVVVAHRAAEQGEAMGMSVLAIAYAEGRGTERNDEEAQMWRLLADETVKVAGASIDELDRRLTPAVRAKAEARAEAWRRAHPPAPVDFPD